MRASCAALSVALLMPAPLLAQQPQQPPGSTGGLFGGYRSLDPNRTSQTLALTVDLSTGYDENVAPDSGGGPTPALDGRATTANAALRYWLGRTGRSIEANGRGFVNRQAFSAGNMVGGEATLRAAGLFGRRTGADAGFGVSYEPTFLFNGFGGLLAPIEGEPAPPEVAPPQGVIEQRWIATQGSASVFRNWTSRQRMDVQFNLLHRRPTEGEGLNSRTYSAVARHAWSLRRSAGLQFSYGFTENQQGDATTSGLPLRTHTLEGGIRLERRVAPERSLVFVATGGSTYAHIERVGGVPAGEYFVPTVSTSARLDVSRTWNVAAEFNRDVTVLEGLTPEPFTGDVAGVRLAGQVGRRLALSIAGAFSRGEALVTRTGSYESLAGTASAQVYIARWCSAFASYSYYEHRTTDVATLQPGFPSRYDRNSVRAGLTVWLPLYGTF